MPGYSASAAGTEQGLGSVRLVDSQIAYEVGEQQNRKSAGVGERQAKRTRHGGRVYRMGYKNLMKDCPFDPSISLTVGVLNSVCVQQWCTVSTAS